MKLLRLPSTAALFYHPPHSQRHSSVVLFSLGWTPMRRVTYPMLLSGRTFLVTTPRLDILRSVVSAGMRVGHCSSYAGILGRRACDVFVSLFVTFTFFCCFPHMKTQTLARGFFLAAHISYTVGLQLLSFLDSSPSLVCYLFCYVTRQYFVSHWLFTTLYVTCIRIHCCYGLL